MSGPGCRCDLPASRALRVPGQDSRLGARNCDTNGVVYRTSDGVAHGDERVRPVFKLSIALVACALVAWLGFVVWSIYSFLPRGADDASRDVERVPVRSGSATPELREAEPTALQARNIEPPAQIDSGAELQPSGDINGCNDPNATVQWSVADPLFAPPGPTSTPPEMLVERAMAGNVVAQFWVGFNLQQQVVMRVPTKDRSTISPQRFEYMRSFLILAAKNGSRSAAHALAEAYIATDRDVVETAAWLRIAGRRRDRPDDYLTLYERDGIIVLSNEQRAESLRVAAELGELYDLPFSVAPAPLVTDDDTSALPPEDCISSRSDPLSLVAADLEAYRADVKSNSFATGIVSEEELQRRFRDLRRRLVKSLRLGNGSALPMLVTLHRESPASENAVAAAVWARIGSERYGIELDADAPDASAADTTPALPPSADLPILSEAQIVDPEFRAVVDDLRRRGISPGTLADQYLMLFDLD